MSRGFGVIIGAQYKLLYLFNISNLLYFLESALLSASSLSSQVLVLVCGSSLPLVQFKLSFLHVRACLMDFLAQTGVTQVSSLG